MATSVLKAASSTPNIPATATISAVDRAVLEKMSSGSGSPDRLELGSSADSLKLKRILHGQSSASTSSSESDGSCEGSAKSSRVSVKILNIQATEKFTKDSPNQSEDNRVVSIIEKLTKYV